MRLSGQEVIARLLSLALVGKAGDCVESSSDR
jgi:hypothetical protein